MYIVDTAGRTWCTGRDVGRARRDRAQGPGVAEREASSETIESVYRRRSSAADRTELVDRPGVGS
ncbi:hypothetical protein HUT18_06165 [Streptomyces sp. NA04227]|uniref:hypothetical protein n=1 Tax=Streptomyces sp. NA04227 TaxID=2742136 RepID=UPI0015903CA9|nr:hypothetical protein [Streptomyces sp. NA04227]QKW06044.1 hypothetical protein HUT18_06165 [Streptomyces sp. NA04227]